MKNISKLFIILFFILSTRLYANDDSVLRVGINAHYQPFGYLSMNLELMGFDVDLIEEISKRVGFDYKLVEMSYSDILESLKNGKLDIGIAAINKTPAAMEYFDFSNTYFQSEHMYLKMKNNTDIKTKSDLNGKILGVEAGSLEEKEAKKIGGAIVHSFTTTETLTHGLRNGILDAILINSAIGVTYLNKNSYFEAFLLEPNGSLGLAIAMKKGADEELIEDINLALDVIINDGTYDRLLSKYNLKYELK